MLTTLILTATAAVTQYGDSVCVFDPHALNWEERTTAECLQGLVNRDSAIARTQQEPRVRRTPRRTNLSRRAPTGLWGPAHR